MIIIGRASGEEIGIISLPAVNGRLAAEPLRVGWIPEQEAELLGEISGIIGSADEPVDAVLNDLGQGSCSRHDERAALRHGLRRGQSEDLIP